MDADFATAYRDEARPQSARAIETKLFLGHINAPGIAWAGDEIIIIVVEATIDVFDWYSRDIHGLVVELIVLGMMGRIPDRLV